MSMNFSDFRRQLNSDPASQDAEYQAARRSEPEFVQAAATSDAFERQLQRATQLPVNSKLTAELQALASSAPGAEESLVYRFRYAMAATVILALSGILLSQLLTPRFDSVESYVAQHYNHDGSKVLAMADTPNAGELGEILATFDLQMDTSMSQQVQFVKYCPTPEGSGVHLVISTEQGLVTVIVMPGQKVNSGERFAFNDMQASLISLPGQDVSAAIITSPEQMNAAQGARFDRALQEALLKRTTGA